MDGLNYFPFVVQSSLRDELQQVQYRPKLYEHETNIQASYLSLKAGFRLL
jgi:hypothetical protein